MKLKTINDINVQDEEFEYKFQPELTKKLDEIRGDFSQEIINEIILWKVNRYSLLSESTLEKLNLINNDSIEINEELTTEILQELLNTKGIQIAMASTILRFKNPNIYQIIDQRVYRFIYGDTGHKTTGLKNDEIIKIYLKYLKNLKKVCDQNNIDFRDSDRILYALDKKINKDFKIKY